MAMEYRKKIKRLDAVPFTHNHLANLLSDYKDPDSKIRQLVKSGEIVRIKRGLYIAGELYRNTAVSQELLANLLYGPSYVSMEFALAYYGLIPERVHEVTSMTTKLHKEFEVPFGRYSYIKSSECLYPVGITTAQNSNGTTFMIATREKALCDTLLFTKKLKINSKKGMREYLEKDIRLEIDILKTFDPGIIEECMVCGRKVKMLALLDKIIKEEIRMADA